RRQARGNGPAADGAGQVREARHRDPRVDRGSPRARITTHRPGKPPVRSMRLRLLGARAALAAFAALIAFPATGAAMLKVSFANQRGFPSRALLVAAPASKLLNVSAVHVTENGGPVRDLQVTPLSVANPGDFGVILLIDTSPSMKGAPDRQAMVAARALAA